MKALYCWRCQIEVPMLDEEEFARVYERIPGAMHSEGKTVRERFAPLLAEYERITGFKESNPNAIMHHRISLYGQPCTDCGKPLRTPKASFCAACGTRSQ